MHLIESTWQDVRYAARSLIRTPGFTVTAVLTLALSIGAQTAIFSVFDRVLLRPLPYPDADRLYVIHEVIPAIAARMPRAPVNAFHFREWRGATRSFEDMALLGPMTQTLTGAGEPVRINGARVTPSLFSTLGVHAALGRTFLEEEDVPGRDGVVILSHELWTTQFGSDPKIVGRTIALDSAPQVVVGVLPAGFDLPKLPNFTDLPVPFERERRRPQIWRPFAATSNELTPLGAFNYIAIGRLKPNVSSAQALDDLNAVQADLARRAPERAEFRAALVPMADQIAKKSKTGLQLVLAAVALVLVIACVNVTNLLLARGARRQREFAIRRAAGARRARLVSQMLVESLVLSVLAAGVSLVVGSWLVSLLQTYAPVDLPRLEEVTLDARILLFTFAVTLSTGLLIGVLPAWRLTKPAPVEVLRSSVPIGAGNVGAGRLRSLLVGIEVAVSAVCLVVGALLVTSFINLMSVDRGFESERLVAVDFFLPPARYDTVAKGIRFMDDLAERTRSISGVSSVAVSDALPLSGLSNSAIMIEGSTLRRQERPVATIRAASPDYFRTLGIPLQAGRVIEDTDAGRRVAVISRLAAERLWPQQDPLGKRFRFGPDDSPLLEVIGVVGNVRSISLSENPPLQVYLPTSGARFFFGRVALAVKTSADPGTIAASIRTAVRQLDPELAVPTPRTMDDIVADSVAQRRFQMNLLLLLAASALFLAGLGIYAVVSQSVAQRTSEFGVRMALGAESSNIRTLVLRQGLLPVVLGLAAGILASFGTLRFIQSLLFGVSATYVAPFAAAAVFLMSVATLASLVPAWRASRLDPMRALRVE